MNSNILVKVNNFIKDRIIELFGTILIIFSFFLIASIITYSPSDPNFIYNPESTDIKNIGGFYGSVVSDFLLQSIGLVSVLLSLNFLFWGIKIITKKKLNNIITKFFYIFCFIIFGTTFLNISYDYSYWLIDNGNGGFVGRNIKENIYYLTPLVENTYIIYVLILLTIIFFILSLGIKYDEIGKIIIFPFKLIKKIFNLFKNEEKKPTVNLDTLNIQPEPQSTEQNL